jgi:hypothetical protein
MDSLALVYAAVDEVNASSDTKIERAPETALLGQGSQVDSLLLVNLLVALEGLASDQSGVSVSLMDEEVFSAPEEPLRTLGSLADYLSRRIGG